jgi:hypothetical protein
MSALLLVFRPPVRAPQATSASLVLALRLASAKPVATALLQLKCNSHASTVT